MSKLKVFGGTGYLPPHQGQRRIIVAATSQKEAAKLIGLGLYAFNSWYSQTGNNKEIEVATSKPGVLFSAPLDQRDKEYEEYVN